MLWNFIIKNVFWLSRKKVWIITLSATFSVLFYGYSLIAMFPFIFFFSEKKKQKNLALKKLSQAPFARAARMRALGQALAWHCGLRLF